LKDNVCLNFATFKGLCPPSSFSCEDIKSTTQKARFCGLLFRIFLFVQLTPATLAPRQAFLSPDHKETNHRLFGLTGLADNTVSIAGKSFIFINF
jgi:hypothetical protein